MRHMPRSRDPIPSYVKHKQSGRARAVWTDSNGLRHFRMLPGPFGSKESRSGSRPRLELELASSPTGSLTNPDEITVSEVSPRHLEHAEQHYRRADGSQTHELDEYKLVYKLVRELYGDQRAEQFGPLRLKAVRSAMLDRDWCRNVVNQRIGRLRRIFKWAAGEELIPFKAYQALTAVTGLQIGRTPARESEPVQPVDDAVVDATLPHLNRHVRGLVEFQRLTGCRPGEACLMRRATSTLGVQFGCTDPGITSWPIAGSRESSPLARRPKRLCVSSSRPTSMPTYSHHRAPSRNILRSAAIELRRVFRPT